MTTLTRSTGRPSAPVVLILGANGRLGRAAARAFDAAGWCVLAQVRRDPSPDLPARAVVLKTAVTDTTLLAAQAHGARVVLHALNPRLQRWRDEAVPLLLAGLAVAQRLQARLLLPGDVQAYGAAMPERLSPSTPCRPSTPLGEVRLAMEQAVARRCSRGDVSATILTSGQYFGAGCGGWLDRVIAAALPEGRWTYPGPLDVPHAWAYLPDLAATLVALAAAPSHAAYERFMFRGLSLTGAQWLTALDTAALELGLWSGPPLRRQRMSWTLLRAGGLVHPGWRARAQLSHLWRVPHDLDERTLFERIGEVPMTPLGDALRASLAARFPAARPTTAAGAIAAATAR
ncbi:MAG: NAD-dependent epimerase/dehydratase family protein [Burkholderiales bacterium]|nr:NAD-dependent epimerase/dehydratase family protein [Burkholderiales bacterium]